MVKQKTPANCRGFLFLIACITVCWIKNNSCFIVTFPLMAAYKYTIKEHYTTSKYNRHEKDNHNRSNHHLIRSEL